jgi:hypothetical protein
LLQTICVPCAFAWQLFRVHVVLLIAALGIPFLDNQLLGFVRSLKAANMEEKYAAWWSKRGGEVQQRC